jgi:hypothetical protein
LLQDGGILEGMKLKHLLWLLPLILLVALYGAEGASVFWGSSDHYDLLAPLGYSPELTIWFTWLSVVVDFAGALLAIFYPGRIVFAALAIWTWIPRAISTVTGVGDMGDIATSVAISAFSYLSYIAWRRGYYFKVFE